MCFSIYHFIHHYAAYLVVIVITCYIRPLQGTIAPGEIRLIHFSPNFISTFPIQVFAFTCAQNVSRLFCANLSNSLKYECGQLFPIFNEVSSNTQKRMNTVIATSICSATLTYEVIAIFGYLTFGSKVSSLCFEPMSN
jgi:amino acid permease